MSYEEPHIEVNQLGWVTRTWGYGTMYPAIEHKCVHCGKWFPFGLSPASHICMQCYGEKSNSVDNKEGSVIEWYGEKAKSLLEERQSQMSLTGERVTEIFLDCLFREGEDTSNHIKAEGITTNVGFHPERLEGHRTEIEAMLMELPDQFLLSKGGGWSFLNACMDRNDIQWGEHKHMEELILLGIGLNKVRFCMPRSMWSVLPGGMPYFVVLDK